MGAGESLKWDTPQNYVKGAKCSGCTLNPELGRLRHKVCLGFQASLHCIVRPFLKTKQTKELNAK